MEVQQFVSLMPWTVIFQICNLLILCALMKKFLFKPVMNILNKRQQEIDNIYASANEDRTSATEMKNEYMRRMGGAREEADRLVRSAVETANQKSNDIIDDAHTQAINMKRRAESEIDQERRKAYSELKNEISGMAVDIAEKMVEREINAQDQSDLVDDFIRNAGDDK